MGPDASVQDTALSAADLCSRGMQIVKYFSDGQIFSNNLLLSSDLRVSGCGHILVGGEVGVSRERRYRNTRTQNI